MLTYILKDLQPIIKVYVMVMNASSAGMYALSSIGIARVPDKGGVPPVIKSNLV